MPDPKRHRICNLTRTCPRIKVAGQIVYEPRCAPHVTHPDYPNFDSLACGNIRLFPVSMSWTNSRPGPEHSLRYYTMKMWVRSLANRSCKMKANKGLNQWGQVKDTKSFERYLAIKSSRKRIFLPLIRTPTIIDSEQGQEDLGMSNSNISNNLKKEYFF